MSAVRRRKGPILVTGVDVLRGAIVAGYMDDELRGTSEFPLEASRITAMRETVAAERRRQEESSMPIQVTSLAQRSTSMQSTDKYGEIQQRFAEIASEDPQTDTDEILRREFASNPSLQDEFGTFEIFRGYRQAMSRGLIRMIGGAQ